MSLGVLLVAILAVLLGWITFRRLLLYRKMAPGPYGLPIVGMLPHLLRVDPVLEMNKYAKKYGKVFSLSVGEHVTVVADPKLILSTLKRDEFQGRPDFPMWDVRNDGTKNRGILLSDAPVWTEQRRFVLRSLRDFGLGKESMEGMLVHELQELQAVLKKDLGHPITLAGMFNASVLNSLWAIVTGKRFELGDPTLKTLITLMIDYVRHIGVTPVGQYFFSPIKYGLMKRSLVTNLIVFLDKIRVILRKMVDEHVEAYEDGVMNDFVDSYLHQMKESSPGSTFYSDEGKRNLEAVLLDLFLAGAETTSTTLQWAMLYMSCYPEVQKKVQQELDRVIGRRPPGRSDKSNLVYCEAVMNEIHRVVSLAPFNVSHKATQDSEIDGHFVPKGCVVLYSLNAMHHDKELWGDPYVFRPERHLDKSGTKLVKYENLIPFSTGKRQCLGESLARDTLYMFFTGLVQKFTFEIDPNSKPKSLKGSSTFISSPPPFKVILKERKQ